MKKIIILLILSFVSCKNQTENEIGSNSYDFENSEFRNPKYLTVIDSTKTNQQVENLINDLLDEKYKKHEKFLIKKVWDFTKESIYSDYCKRTANSLGINKAFYKGDFDGNQLTDLLVTGDFYGFNIFTVLSFENDSLGLNQLTRSHSQECAFPKIKDDSIIEYYYQPYNGFAKEDKPGKKLLVYKFDDFVELNESPVNHKIDKIEFETGPCFGTCPIFSLTLQENKKSRFKAIAYNFNDDWQKRDWNKNEGEFQTNLNKESWDELIEILNYIDFENLKNSYAVNWTDDQSVELKIYYDNGKVKEINDYGLIGTFGLSILYHKLFEIRKNQDWKKE